jgi:hypothetical protein
VLIPLPVLWTLVSPQPDATGARHAVVVGMHRSGTSATAHMLVELGLSTPPSGDLIGAGPFNQRGYWETTTVSRFDELILRQLGGTWSAPPRSGPGWPDADDPAMGALRGRAVEISETILAHPPLVMKDPRLCLTLPFWRRVLPSEPVAVLVYRDPLEVALSLLERDGFPLTLGLALWQRYVRESFASVEGLPVLVVEYAQALRDPPALVAEVSAFLDAHGITTGSHRAQGAAAVFAAELRHHRSDALHGALRADQQDLLDVLRSRRGAFDSWHAPALPAEPSWVGDVIELSWSGQVVTAAMQVSRQELKWLQRSRLFRATSALWRVTGTGPALSAAGGEVGDPARGSNGTAPSVHAPAR